MRKVKFEIDNELLEGEIALAPDGVLWVHLGGETFTYSAPTPETARSRSRGKGRASAPNEVNAPMPGKVTKLHVKPGDSVSSGQPLLVMEAMKMEYTLKAQAEGLIETISCAPGEQVALGQNLIKLKL